MSSYQPGIPTGTINLDQDYLNIQSNFTQLNSLFSIDHRPLTDTSSLQGYHKTIHQVPFSTTTSSNRNGPTNYPPTAPTAVIKIGEIFTAEINDGLTTDTALYFETGNGTVIPITRTIGASSTANGYAFLVGGLMIQWGTFSATSIVSSPVTFPKPFKTSVYNIQISYVVDDTTTIRNGIQTGSISKTGFTWIGTSSSHLTSIYWMAIGD